MFLIFARILRKIRKRKKRKRKGKKEEVEEEMLLLKRLPGVPTKFSFEELRAATNNFSKKLGQGGFASVFEGTLVDGIKIAVKRIKSIAHGTKDFLAEVQIIGSIHHVNLVKLIGYCVEKTNKLLVYEYMSNGSLDKWIYQTDQNHVVNWQTRCKIINHVAKGLLYLHEDCSQKIVHLDIKPQNILLDDYFNAKVADFRLSKLIDKDQSCAMTRMRGTPGYMAPEWLTSMITEKVDVYSFGVVVVEIVCMRRNLEHPQYEDSVPLINLLMDMASKGQISNFIEEYSETKEIDENEAIRMLRLAIWCVQSDAKKRPVMSTIVKVLEGSLEVENFDNDHLDLMSRTEVAHPLSSTQRESILSGPR